MDSSSYLRESERTLSPFFHADRVPAGYFVDLAGRVGQLARELDALKRTLCYGAGNTHAAAFGGDPFPVDPADSAGSDARGTLAAFGLDPALLHAALGVITEGAEIFDAAQRPRLDRVHIVEEVGDVGFYLALALRAVGGSFEEAHARNIAKLRRRYPQAFTQAEALTRDLSGERSALERDI